MNVTIISIGNGGFNIASDLKKTSVISDAKFIVCDTDKTDLKAHSAFADETFLLDGLHNNARSAYESFVEQVVDAATDEIIVCVSLGGVAGNKYAPLIALEATLRGKWVCSVLSIPFKFERKGNKAHTAKIKLVVASRLTIAQFNDELKEAIGEMTLDAMNTPLVETFMALLRGHELKDLCTSVTNLQELVPKKYLPLIWLRSDCYRGISDDERKKEFDLYK